MNNAHNIPPKKKWHLRRGRILLNFTKFRAQTALAALLLVVFLGMSIVFYQLYYETRLGPAQPISFSHRVHAGDKQISCLMCHSDVASREKAGLPPVQTCMLCHTSIIIAHPEVQKVRAHFAQNEPVLWNKVFVVPDFVFFNHAAHIRRSVDCSRCHGNINRMDRVTQPEELTMGFCVRCHRQNKVSVDCYVCHR